MPKPVASRASLPEDYGLAPDSPLLSWPTLEARLMRARHYWLATSGADGIPVMRPIDGMWLDTALYFDGHSDTRWRRNLVANARASVTLEGAQSAVILEGVVTRVTPDTEIAAALAAQANAKYELAGQSAADYEVELCMFKPRQALAWTVLFQDATRFRFD